MNEKFKIGTQAFDDAVRNKLYDMEIEPNASLWANIEDAIQNDAPPKKNRRSGYWLLLLAFVSLMGVSASSSYYIIRESKHKKDAITANAANQFAQNYNKANLTMASGLSNINSGVSNSPSSYTNNQKSSNVFVLDKIITNATGESHYILNKKELEPTYIASIARDNRISNYKEVPTLMIEPFKEVVQHVTFNGTPITQDPVFVTNKGIQRGFYSGVDVQSGATIMSKKNTQNAMLGKNLQFAPSAFYKAGAILGYNINSSIAVQSGVNYAYKCVPFTGTYSDVKNVGDIKLSYVDIPLLLKYKYSFNENKKTPQSVQVYAGASYQYLLRAEVNMDNAKMVHYKDKQYNAKPYLPNHMMGAVGGVEYQITLRKNINVHIGAEANYSGSATQLLPASSNTQTTPFTNFGVGLRTGITFSSKKCIKP